MQRRPSPQDISWFLDLRSNNQLDLEPPYQRKSVWTLKDRRYFIDTILRDYPSPVIFLSKSIVAGKSCYSVVDGKQRLETIFRFVDNELSIAEDYGDVRLNGKKWDELSDEHKKGFWNYIIPVEFLNFDEADVQSVNIAFDRLNRNSKKLDAQELRHARWSGWFINKVEGECDDDLWKVFKVSTKARAKRMKDAQFISELLLISIELKQHGFDQELLDEAYAKYDDVDESEVAFDPDQSIENFDFAKNYLKEINDLNSSVVDLAASLQHFYTLWFYVVINKNSIPPAAQLSQKLKDFIDRLKLLKDATVDQRDSLLNNGDAVKNQHVYDFLLGGQGASTDLGPRTKRFVALNAFFAL